MHVVLAAALLFAQVPMPVLDGVGAVTVKAEEALEIGDTVVLRFKDSSGKKYLRDLQMTAKFGDRVKLPVLKGFQWKLDDQYAFPGGSGIRLSSSQEWIDSFEGKNLTFQAEKIYYAQFYNSDGTSPRAFKKLQKTVAKGDAIKLSKVPVSPGYVGLGWSLKKNSKKADYEAGDRVTVKKNLKFYAVRKRTATALVTFSNNKGTSKNKAYTSLKERVNRGTSFKLPQVPKAKGYTSLGWTTEKGKTKPLYKAGSEVEITKDTRFYAVRKKAKTYTVSFYKNNGKTSSSLKKLKETAEKGTYVVLPAVPVKKGYVGLGWSKKKNSSKNVMKAGTKYRVTKNTKLYAVTDTAVTVTLCKNDGTVYRDIAVGKGNYLTLPSVSNVAGYTFMGWSTQKGKSVNPEYEAGGRIRVNSDVRLYAVVFDRAQEQELLDGDFSQVDLWKRKYRQVIFVGDSRTERMKNTLEREFGSTSTVTWNVNFLCKSGKGLEWLKEEGYEALMNMVNKNNNVQNPTAVIFNLGINDLANLPGYVEYMETIGEALKEKNCQLFYMSVNPGNSKMMENTGHAIRPEASIRQFNKTIRADLGNMYAFIDTYSWLMSTGYGTNSSGIGKDNSVDDGLHYTTKTYKRIFYHCLEYLLTQNT